MTFCRILDKRKPKCYNTDTVYKEGEYVMNKYNETKQKPTIRNKGYVPQVKSVNENYENICNIRGAFWRSINEIWNDFQTVIDWQNYINSYYNNATQMYYYYNINIAQQQFACNNYKTTISMKSEGWINRVYQTISDSMHCINVIYGLSSEINKEIYDNELEKFCRLYSINISCEAEQILKSLRIERNQAIHNFDCSRFIQYIFNNNTVYIINDFIEIIFNAFNNIISSATSININ